MRRRAIWMLAALLAYPAARAAGEEKLDAYLEWREGRTLVVDGQRLIVGSDTRFKGRGRAFGPTSIPLGYEIRAKGERQPDGTIALEELDARPNAQAWLEADVRKVTDAAEAKYRKIGRFVEEDADGRVENVGRLLETGPQVERVRRIVDRMVPPYLDPDDVRVYVIDNEEWNAFAMGNYSIYVFSGLLEDLDDDEVAIVVGHELVHASHEHTRRQAKEQQKLGLGVLGALFLSNGIGNDVARGAAQIVTQLGAVARSSGYGRDLEDQADRVGMRYAYEAGYDITKGPALWKRFADKYGQPNQVVNFFFSDHSLSEARAKNLDRELALNYPHGPRLDRSRADRVAERPPSSARPAAGAPRGAVGLAANAGNLSQSPPRRHGSQTTNPRTPSRASSSTRIEVGMTEQDVRGRLGGPRKEVNYGDRTKWVYRDLSVVFENGVVSEVQF